MFGKKIFWAIFATTAFVVSNVAMAGSEIYKEGMVKIFQAEIPKYGFVGSPRPHGFPPMHKPTKPDDFDIHYVRATILAERSIEGGKRNVIRVDEVTSVAQLIRHGIYYVYVDMLKDGERIVYHERDDHHDELDAVVTYGIPCPFICARPPATNAKRFGYVDYRVGFGIDYKMKDTKETTGGLEVEATWFNTTSPDPNAKRMPKWYQSNIEDVYKNPKTRVLFREKQVWSRPEGWLFREMERYDASGNILIRCKEVYQGNDKTTKTGTE